MARNDIRFGQAGQADFSQANAMFRISQEQLNNALATGKSTLDEINKAVTANNDAKIKQFINSFGKDELEANRDTINEFIQDVGLHSGNMYSRNEIEEYHDKRMNDLITRDNTHMLNKEKALQHENILANHEADKFVAGITSLLNDPNKTEVQRQKVIDDMIAEARQAGSSDMTLAYANKGAYDVWGKSIDGQLGRLTGTNNIADGYLNQIVGLFEPLAREVTNAQTHLDNVVASRDSYPNAQAYDQAVAEATQALQTSQANAHAFMRANESKIPMGMQMDKFNTSVASILEQQVKARQQSHKMNMDIAELERKEKATNNAFMLGMTNAGISQQRANQDGAYQQGQLDLGGAKLVADINGLTSGGNGGKTKLNKDNPNYETLTKLGINSDGSYDVKEFANKYASAMQSLKTKTEAQKNAVKYNDWIMNEGANYAKAIHDTNTPSPFEDNLSEIQDTFPAGASEYEKIEIVKAYGNNPRYPINKKNTAIIANNAKIQMEENIRTEYYKEFANILQAMSSIHPDVTAESLTALLVEQGNLPTDILATIPVEYLNSYTALKEASNTSKKPKNINFDKAVKSLFERKGSGDGTLLKDLQKRNMGDGKGTMLIDPNAPKPPTKVVPKETDKVPYRGASMGKFFYPDKY
nr:MAG TPA: hypothetical protein [Caudoviricetes sp.]